MDIVNRAQAAPFLTKDGSQIRELLAHRNSVIRNQSLAEATLAVGSATQEHFHPKSEEIYYILSGTGRMKLDGELRQALKDRQGGYTLQQYAAEIGISLPMLGQILTGARSVGNQKVLEYLAPRGMQYVHRDIWHLIPK